MVEAQGNLDDAWKDLKTPFMAHRKQALIYLGVAHDMHSHGSWYRDSPEGAALIYENKANQEVKGVLGRL